MIDRIALSETTKLRAKECAIMEWQLEIIQEAVGGEVEVELYWIGFEEMWANVTGGQENLFIFDPDDIHYNAKLGRDENISFNRAFDAWCTERGIVPF